MANSYDVGSKTFLLDTTCAASDLAAIKGAALGGVPPEVDPDYEDTITQASAGRLFTFTIDVNLSCHEMTFVDSTTSVRVIVNDGLIVQTRLIATRKSLSIGGSLALIGTSNGAADQSFAQNLDSYNKAIFVKEPDSDLYEAWQYMADLDDANISSIDKVYMVTGGNIVFGDGLGGGGGNRGGMIPTNGSEIFSPNVVLRPDYANGQTTFTITAQYSSVYVSGSSISGASLINVGQNTWSSVFYRCGFCDNTNYAWLRGTSDLNVNIVWDGCVFHNILSVRNYGPNGMGGGIGAGMYTYDTCWVYGRAASDLALGIFYSTTPVILKDTLFKSLDGATTLGVYLNMTTGNGASGLNILYRCKVENAGRGILCLGRGYIKDCETDGCDYALHLTSTTVLTGDNVFSNCSTAVDYSHSTTATTRDRNWYGSLTEYNNGALHLSGPLPVRGDPRLGGIFTAADHSSAGSWLSWLVNWDLISSSADFPNVFDEDQIDMPWDESSTSYCVWTSTIGGDINLYNEVGEFIVLPTIKIPNVSALTNVRVGQTGVAPALTIEQYRISLDFGDTWTTWKDYTDGDFAAESVNPVVTFVQFRRGSTTQVTIGRGLVVNYTPTAGAVFTDYLLDSTIRPVETFCKVGETARLGFTLKPSIIGIKTQEGQPPTYRSGDRYVHIQRVSDSKYWKSDTSEWVVAEGDYNQLTFEPGRREWCYDFGGDIGSYMCFVDDEYTRHASMVLNILSNSSISAGDEFCVGLNAVDKYGFSVKNLNMTVILRNRSGEYWNGSSWGAGKSAVKLSKWHDGLWYYQFNSDLTAESGIITAMMFDEREQVDLTASWSIGESGSGYIGGVLQNII